ncbi:MAG: zf-HC2 domain-containing protein [Armatimonadetes bacterium]|nr:zf-HC2 domain-containing protein [Armatimonadota bacterium]
MNCKQARRLMQEIADGTRTDHAEFDRHIAQCPGCRREWQALQRIQGAVASIARCAPPAERLERATVGALQMIERQRSRALVGLSRLGWAAAAALLIAVFASGLYAGRTVWPREAIVTNTVKVPEVREKIVEVEVPVVKERIVIKRVPVYKTIIVYRDREVEKPVPVVTPAETPAVPTPDQFVTQPETEPLINTVTVFQETRPARLAEEVEPQQLEPTQGRRDSPGTEIAQVITDKITTKSNAPTS